jgi:hypothetical protein
MVWRSAVEASTTQAKHVQELKVHSQQNCLALSMDEMQRIENNASVSISLDPGIHLIKLRQEMADSSPTLEPAVMFWIYGGSVINRSTDTEVTQTWTSLQGYDDVLALDVKQSAQLCALFFGTESHPGQLSLSVAKL